MFAKCRIAFRAHTKSYPVYHERLSDSPVYRWAWRGFAPQSHRNHRSYVGTVALSGMIKAIV